MAQLVCQVGEIYTIALIGIAADNSLLLTILIAIISMSPVVGLTLEVCAKAVMVVDNRLNSKQ